LLLAACISVALQAGSALWAQESIERLPGAHKQQEIEVIRSPASQQQVMAVDGTGQQDVTKNEIPSPAQRRLNTVSKVAVGVLATGVALAASAASLLLL
jgi:hypothetical protein